MCNAVATPEVQRHYENIFYVEFNWKKLTFLCTEKKLQLGGIRPFYTLDSALAEFLK